MKYIWDNQRWNQGKLWNKLYRLFMELDILCERARTYKGESKKYGYCCFAEIHDLEAAMETKIPLEDVPHAAIYRLKEIKRILSENNEPCKVRHYIKADWAQAFYAFAVEIMSRSFHEILR